MNRKEIEQTLQQYKLRPIKKLGQNFLINEKAISIIVKTVQKLPTPFVEVGPGLGALSRHFESLKKEMTLIEKDKKLASYWNNQSYSVVTGDALKINWNKLPKTFTLFGNLPYEIAGRLILKSCLLQNQIQDMVFLMQKEVAQRVTARSHKKNYGLLSVMSQEIWDISPLLDIPNSDFYPRPKVDGRVLVFKRKKRQDKLDLNLFLKFVKACFSFKRKMLFKQIGIRNPTKAKNIIRKLDLIETCRAEELSPSQFVQLYFLIKEKKGI